MLLQTAYIGYLLMAPCRGRAFLALGRRGEARAAEVLGVGVEGLVEGRAGGRVWGWGRKAPLLPHCGRRMREVVQGPGRALLPSSKVLLVCAQVCGQARRLLLAL